MKQKTQKGFSFGETLLAAFVLSIGLVTLVKMFQVSISNSFAIRNATIATELSQEGVELVRGVRDNNFAAGGNGFAAFDSGKKHCYMSYDSSTLNCFAGQGDTTMYNLYFNGTRYVSTVAPQKFRRYIYVEYNNGNQEAIVRSFVVWDGRVLPSTTGSPTGCSIENKCVYAEVTLTNWKS